MAGLMTICGVYTDRDNSNDMTDNSMDNHNIDPSLHPAIVQMANPSHCHKY